MKTKKEKKVFRKVGRPKKTGGSSQRTKGSVHLPPKHERYDHEVALMDARAKIVYSVEIAIIIETVIIRMLT